MPIVEELWDLRWEASLKARVEGLKELLSSGLAHYLSLRPAPPATMSAELLMNSRESYLGLLDQLMDWSSDAGVQLRLWDDVSPLPSS